ncbi:hypothetical protein R5N98_06825 [Tenacibaculum maritimum]|nr:hypothetical protein [Tenacibaculum maritimum]CAA0172953.1 hypothetical protein FS0810_140019 [Tenacibaculum maritimum]CAA0176357.1 hypothetical protein NACSLCCMFF_190028 [Tenacibaculum maritimum]CAA0239866.1 hypothetical protein CVI1001048_70049 [Tenacibaculum maritimum]
MLYIIGIILIIWIVVRLYNRSTSFYEVIDQYGNTKTFGKYNQCTEWVKAQKGMENLSGINNTYRIRKKKL